MLRGQAVQKKRIKLLFEFRCNGLLSWLTMVVGMNTGASMSECTGKKSSPMPVPSVPGAPPFPDTGLVIALRGGSSEGTGTPYS